MKNKIDAAIIGATGYAGAEIVRLLLGHPNVNIKILSSKSYAGKTFSEIFRGFKGVVDDTLVSEDLEAFSRDCDVIFTATPQGYLSTLMNTGILSNAKVIDLSADYRIRDVHTYEKWYGITHGSPELLHSAVYGLCEVYRDHIKNTSLLANPGCYTTCSILALYPLVKEGIIDTDTIVIDAKSGTSGAGRSAKTDTLFCEVNESIKAYGIGTHRHTPEIEQELSVASGKNVVLNFTPHLVPMDRGILATSYGKLTRDISYEDIREIYDSYYGSENFIRLMDKGVFPETRWVYGSNFIDIGFTLDERTGRVIVVSALDNLIKGAAGQAVQNMNIMFGFEEKAGLCGLPVFP